MKPGETSPRSQVRVVKVGGSLLDWPPLKTALPRWLAAQPAGQSILIAGGGALADAIRQAHQVHGLSEEAAHWLCVDVLDVTAGLLACLLGYDPLPSRYAGNRSRPWISVGDDWTIFRPAAWLHHEEPHCSGPRLPRNWSVTSDSIAARLAGCLEAGELVLLKSQEAPQGESFEELARGGYVDPHFPLAAADLPVVRMVNLRSWG